MINPAETSVINPPEVGNMTPEFRAQADRLAELHRGDGSPCDVALWAAVDAVHARLEEIPHLIKSLELQIELLQGEQKHLNSYQEEHRMLVGKMSDAL